MATYAEKRFGCTKDLITVPDIEFLHIAGGIQHDLLSTATC
jgi:hypothetical protein